MKVFHYQMLGNNQIRLDTVNGPLWVQLTKDSGRIVTRNKVGTFKSIQHTGIWLGKNIYTGQDLIIHNHYHYGAAHVTTYEDYAQSEDVFFVIGTCTNQPTEVVKKGLNQIIIGKPYRLVSNNCQILTSKACNNVAHSPDVTKWGGLLLSAALTVVVIKAITA